jgi:3-oxoacyl-[acyl-carrier-protein] synthase-3
MASNEVYIIRTSSYFPNDPVSNEEMEEYLHSRYYALDKEGRITHSNAQITAGAVRALFPTDPEKMASVELLVCGTSSPDQLMPAHGVMVHGELPETGPIEVVSPAGVCCAGMHALKYAYYAIGSGEVKLAVSAGSERFSALLRSSLFEDEAQKLRQLEENPYIGFEKEFLRWMLSDGAAAFLLSNKKNDQGISLRVDWLEGFSYAQQMEACMYMGGEKMADGKLKGYLDYSPADILNQSILSIKQDVKLLGEYIVYLGGEGLAAALSKHGVTTDRIDHFLPHMSSEFFRSKIYDRLLEKGLGIPYDKWRANLSTVGNVGAASIYLMVDELFREGKLEKGQKLLLLVPESARFSYMYGVLTVC